MMRSLFYNIVENMVERMTGITNGEIKLWELGTWYRASESVELILNIVCLLGVVLVSYLMYEIVKFIIKNTKKGKRYIES